MWSHKDNCWLALQILMTDFEALRTTLCSFQDVTILSVSTSTKKKKKKRPKEGLGLKRGDSPMRKRISSYNQADTNKLSNTNVLRTFLLVCFWFFSSYMDCCRNTSKTHRVIFLHRCDLTGITRGKTLFVSNGIKLMRWLQAEGEAHSAGSRLLSTSETKFHQQTFQQRENEWDVNRANQKASDTENRHKPTSKNPQTNNSY